MNNLYLKKERHEHKRETIWGRNQREIGRRMRGRM
jgi:hypothetical protein